MRERPFSIQEIFFGGAGREPSAKMEKTLEYKKKKKKRNFHPWIRNFFQSCGV